MLVSELSASLTIPPEFSKLNALDEDDTALELQRWKQGVAAKLDELRKMIQDASELSMDDRADAISSTVAFSFEKKPWVTSHAHDIAVAILGRFEPDVQLLRHILLRNVKPVFSHNLHPHINPESGRKLSRPAGGQMATSDYYEDQTWKQNLAAGYIVEYVVQHLKAEDYETIWPLLIPPLMTILDDYQVPYKLHSVIILRQMLQNLSASLLRRTGLDVLLTQSLTTCLGQLDSPESPTLVKEVVLVWLQLTLMTTDEGSIQRFDSLCALLGDRIIGSVWFYGSQYPDVILATLDILPDIIRALGIGSARFLKALMHQLLHPLLTKDAPSLRLAQLQARSLNVVIVVIQECAPRMASWKIKILDAVCRCWVSIKEVDSIGLYEDSPEREEVKTRLRGVCKELARTCPTLLENEYKKILTLDEQMFGELLAGL
ncbi:hypothetical protein CYLTODRAFT_418536 [Cylindrobasidium torrendii FP15055 ss-10]|uniref:ARM repeat-containing protein n=1 Tax=Cylindrobasidium torrendii FP15055 ss-10 TaxID=1314674 RepID=A0A0D7BNR3_9AGAR|nr:hypothetical protein CYLTODRAFT_418536 [Cylindrobasidium torrendii FP15055 ss-10]